MKARLSLGLVVVNYKPGLYQLHFHTRVQLCACMYACMHMCVNTSYLLQHILD